MRIRMTVKAENGLRKPVWGEANGCRKSVSETDYGRGYDEGSGMAE